MHFACGHIIVLEMTPMSKTGKSKLISRNEGFNKSGSRQKKRRKNIIPPWKNLPTSMLLLALQHVLS